MKRLFQLTKMFSSQQVNILLLTMALVLFTAGLACSGQESYLKKDSANGKAHEKFIEAKTKEWEIKVSYEEGSLKRNISWKKGTIEMKDVIIPLENRGGPFYNTSNPKATNTAFGPYQPASELLYDNMEWFVVMRHENIDFPALDNLKEYLNLFEQKAAINEKGDIVNLRVSVKGDEGGKVIGNSLGIEIFHFTVDKKEVPEAVMKKYIRGKIKQGEK